MTARYACDSTLPSHHFLNKSVYSTKFGIYTQSEGLLSSVFLHPDKKNAGQTSEVLHSFHTASSSRRYAVNVGYSSVCSKYSSIT